MKTLLLICVLVAGCNSKPHIYQPPFIVVNKIDGKQSTGCNNEHGNCCVVFQDRTGELNYTCEPCDKYSIGDTIK